VSYLVGVHGGEDVSVGSSTGGDNSESTDSAHRRAFDLLYAAESLQQEAEAHYNARGQRSADDAWEHREEEFEEEEENEQDGHHDHWEESRR